jgi:hypothetical protein
MLGTNLDQVGWRKAARSISWKMSVACPTRSLAPARSGLFGGQAGGISYDLGMPVGLIITLCSQWQPDKITWFIDGNPYLPPRRAMVSERKGMGLQPSLLLVDECGSGWQLWRGGRSRCDIPQTTFDRLRACQAPQDWCRSDYIPTISAV